MNKAFFLPGCGGLGAPAPGAALERVAVIQPYLPHVLGGGVVAGELEQVARGIWLGVYRAITQFQVLA